MQAERCDLPAGDAVVVCGAGAAGLAAAIAAARSGRDVCLIEAAGQIGGTVTAVLIHTLAGLFDSHGEIINDGLPRELIGRLERAEPLVRRRRMGRAWVLNVCPSLYGRVVQAWLAEHPRVRVLTGWTAARCVVEDGSLVAIEVNDGRRQLRLRPRGLVDATGTAEVVRLINPALVERDDRPAAGSVIVRLRGVAPGTLDFPRGVGVVRELRDAAERGRLPAECAKAWLDSGVYADEVFLKLFVPVPPRTISGARPVSARAERSRSEQSAAGEPGAQRSDRLVRRACQVRDQMIDFLGTLAGFEGAYVTETGGLGIRDGGRVAGEYRLTVDDVRSGRQFEDSIGRCAWPIEFWHPDEGVSIEYLPDGSSYGIPLRSLKLRGLENVWAAGKCLSAEPLAQASARVVGTCWAMGEAAGRAAAMSAKRAA
jgi:hypothetical protein